MRKQFWINLPVKNVEKSREFFGALGFHIEETMSDDGDYACLLVGTKEVPVMLFQEKHFQDDTRNGLPDTSKGTEVMMSLDAASRQEVDQLAGKAKKAGGTVFCEPMDIPGGMYGCGFTDPDGHRWNILYRE